LPHIISWVDDDNATHFVRNEHA